MLETCARAAHAINNIFCARLGDSLSPAYEELTDAQRAGIIKGVEHAIAGGSPEESHELWVMSRLDEGWSLGPVKSFENKTSPNLIPYSQLPESQRAKDELFQTVVRAVAKACGAHECDRFTTTTTPMCSKDHTDADIEDLRRQMAELLAAVNIMRNVSV